MKLQQILAATDFSNRAARAVNRAAMLAAEHQATLELLHVTSALPEGQAEAEALLGTTHDALHRELLQELEGQMAVQTRAIDERFHVPATSQLVQGKPYFELPRIAAERKADLVVVGSHGERFFYDLFIGSTAEKVLQRITQPFLIVKQKPVGPYRNILVPIDFSPASEMALSVAASYFPDAVFSLVHAYEVPFERKLIGAGVSDSALLGMRIRTEQDALRRISNMVSSHPLSPAQVGIHAVHGHPATVIRDMTERLEPDLIIMGKNEHSALEKLLIGSITRHVLREINCDVLVVAPT